MYLCILQSNKTINTHPALYKHATETQPETYKHLLEQFNIYITMLFGLLSESKSVQTKIITMIHDDIGPTAYSNA